MTDRPLLEVRDVHKHFGGIKAVNGASFELREGAITGLIGPNGAGKTTMFDIVTGHQRPTAGTVHFKGRRIDGLPAHRITRMGMGRTFQLVRLLPRLSALDNLIVATKDHPGESVAGALFGGWKDTEDAARAHAHERLRFTGMDHRADVPAGNLSYGQSKLTEISRALTLESDLLLLDEPMSGINPTLRKRILKLIHDIREDEGKTFFIIEHDIEMIMSECDDIIVMHHGEVLTHGTPDEVRDDERVIEAYLGAGRRRSFTASYEKGHADAPEHNADANHPDDTEATP